MSKAGWLDVWHMALAIVARQPPFVQIMCWTGAAFVLVMAIEGVRTSILAIWRAHRTRSAAAAPAASAAPSPVAEVPATRTFSMRSGPRAAAAVARKRKTLTVAARQFRSSRPTIRRHPNPEGPFVPELPNFAADSAVLRHEGV